MCAVEIHPTWKKFVLFIWMELVLEGRGGRRTDRQTDKEENCFQKQ